MNVYMKFTEVSLIFILFILFSGSGLCNSHYINKEWGFYKTSRTDFFNNHDSDMIGNLARVYQGVTVKYDGKTLVIENPIINEKMVCSFEYVRQDQTLLSYLYSKNTVSLYERIFNEEGIDSPRDIHALIALNPDKECPSPYAQFIEIQDYLVIIDQNYMIFFKSTTTRSKPTQLISNDFSKFCKQENEDEIFDGTSKFKCDFKGMSLLESYDELKRFDSNGDFLKERIPTKNIDFHIHDGMIRYFWENGGLNVVISQGAESWHYTFEEYDGGTRLFILDESGY